MESAAADIVTEFTLAAFVLLTVAAAVAWGWRNVKPELEKMRQATEDLANEMHANMDKLADNVTTTINELASAAKSTNVIAADIHDWITAQSQDEEERLAKVERRLQRLIEAQKFAIEALRSKNNALFQASSMALDEMDRDE